MLILWIMIYHSTWSATVVSDWKIVMSLFHVHRTTSNLIRMEIQLWNKRTIRRISYLSVKYKPSSIDDAGLDIIKSVLQIGEGRPQRSRIIDTD